MDLDRIKQVVLNPRGEWPKIASETVDVRTLYLNHVIPLAAIGPVASFVGMALFGMPLVSHQRPSLLANLVANGLNFVLALGMVWLIAAAAAALAPRFGGQDDRMQALKWAAYAATPSWLAGALYVLPALGVLTLVAGLYSVFVAYLGTKEMLNVPRERAAPFVGMLLVGGLIVSAILSSLIMQLLPGPRF